METDSEPPSSVDDSRDSLPTFDLTFRYDDVENPAELTVFPAAEQEDGTTTWLTIDLEHAVSLETVR